jgi:hypothetical protein
MESNYSSSVDYINSEALLKMDSLKYQLVDTRASEYYQGWHYEDDVPDGHI